MYAGFQGELYLEDLILIGPPSQQNSYKFPKQQRKPHESSPQAAKNVTQTAAKMFSPQAAAKLRKPSPPHSNRPKKSSTQLLISIGAVQQRKPHSSQSKIEE